MHYQFSKMQETLVRRDAQRFNESEVEEKEDLETLRNIDSLGTTSSFSEEEGLHLLALVLQCGEVILEDNYEEANSILPHIYELYRNNILDIKSIETVTIILTRKRYNL